MTPGLLSVTGLRKQFGGIVAVSGVELVIGPGELVCIIGPNGAGKSTLLNLLCGVVQPDTGEIRFDGRSLRGLPLHSFPRSGIVRKFQVPTIFPDLTVRECLRVAGDAASWTGESRPIGETLARVLLEADQDTLAGDLPHGKKQWLEIGICLMCRPKLLLLDEPTAGMTDAETLRTAQLLRELTAESAIVVIEHDMAFVRELNCRTCVMHQGTIVRDGSFGAIEDDTFVRDIYLGKA